MSTAKENKALRVLEEQFQRAADNAKDLQQVIDHFSVVVEEFKVTLETLDEQYAIEEVHELAQKSVAKLKDIQSFNERNKKDMQRIINQQFEKHFTQMEATHQTAQQQLDEKLNRLLSLLDHPLGMERDEQLHRKQDEMMQMLQHMRVSTGSSYQSEETLQLKRKVAALQSRIRKMEIEHEERLGDLEYQLTELRALVQRKEPHISIDPFEDAPF